MERELRELLDELAAYGEVNDSRITERGLRMLNITPDTGEFLVALVGAAKARTILEVGTSNGYSTLWLAYVASCFGGEVSTIENSEFKIKLARENFKRSQLGSYISQICGDALEVLQSLPREGFNFIFLDAQRSEYLAIWPEIDRILTPSGVLVVDNAISHKGELVEFIEAVESSNRYSTSLLNVGKGEYLAVKHPAL